MKGITYCGACADYDIKKHRCKRGAKLESNPQDKFFDDCPLPDAAPVVHGRWECVYDDSMGETDVTCSHCKNTRTVNGCFVSTDGKSCYFEDDYCPYCGAKMDGGDSDAAD